MVLGVVLVAVFCIFGCQLCCVICIPNGVVLVGVLAFLVGVDCVVSSA